MLPAEEIQRSLTGPGGCCWARRTGCACSISASTGSGILFFSILVALPAMAARLVSPSLINWPATSARSRRFRRGRQAGGGRSRNLACRRCRFRIGRKAVAGLGDRFVAYVVASNWGSVVLVWLMLPVAILKLHCAFGEAMRRCSSVFVALHCLAGARLAADQCCRRQEGQRSAPPSSPPCSSLRWSCSFALQGMLGLSVPYSTPTR